MASEASHATAAAAHNREGSIDLAARAVRVALAIYLTPVVATVCAIGLASILLGRGLRGVARARVGRSASPRPAGLPPSMAGSPAWKPLPGGSRDRLRV